MKKSIYAIRMENGSWYRHHGTTCIQSDGSSFPETFYGTKEEAGAKIDSITRDFPNDGIYCSIVRISYSMREVFV